MAENEIALGQTYFCREETTGNNYEGVFRIDESKIEARLYSFDKFFHLREKSLVLRLENNRSVTLCDIYSYGGSGASHDLREPTLSTYSCRVAANIAIIGRGAWAESDPVRRVQFKVAHTDDLLHHIKKFDAVADAKLGTRADPMIFELKVCGMKVAAWYEAFGNLNFKRATSIGVRYSLEFDEPVTMRTYLPWVECIVRFMSAALGHRLVPSEIEISGLSFVDFLKAIEGENYHGDYNVRYIWTETPLPQRSLWIGHAFAHAWDDRELTRFVDCLRAWIERYAAWDNATNLMMQAFTLRDEISPERLLTACKWLEEIPGASSEVVVGAGDIEKIADVAAAEAVRLGHSGFKERVAGVIRGQLKTETNAQRFDRLVASVRKQFGKEPFGKAIIEDLVQATKFRAKAAHVHFNPTDQRGFARFIRCVSAMEALCYLLTIKDLPMKPAGAKRAPGIEMVSNHRLNQ